MFLSIIVGGHVIEVVEGGVKSDRGDKLFTEQELQSARDPDLPPILSLDWPGP